MLPKVRSLVVTSKGSDELHVIDSPGARLSSGHTTTPGSLVSSTEIDTIVALPRFVTWDINEIIGIREHVLAQ